MSRSRILHVIPTLDRSGAEKQLVLLAAGLPRDEFDVRVCALTRGGPLSAELEAAGIPCHAIGKRFKFDPLAWRRLLQHMREVRPDLVQTWLFAANAYGRSAALAAGVPHIVGGERCVDPWKRPHELFLDRWLARRGDRIVANSGGVRDFYVRHGLPAEKFVVIPNGVRVGPAPATNRQELLAELKLPDSARLIGAVGRLWPQKRLEDLIWAADLLKVIRDDAYLLIVGDGPRRDALERYCGQVRIEDRVRFLGHRDDVPRLLSHTELLWLASEYEGLPNVILEAMAAGLPVVASDIPGNRDLVIPGETGWLVAVGDSAGYAKWAERLLSDRDLARRMGAAGRQRVSIEFSVEKMVERFTALYRELLAQNKKRVDF